jgi:hypothetical protein
MDLVRPVTLNGAALVSSNVAVSEPAWSGSTTYGLGGQVRGASGPEAEKVYESVQAANLNHPVTDPAWWIEVGPINRLKMWDGSPSSATLNANSIATVHQLAGRANVVYLEAVSAATARLKITDAIEGVVHDQTYALVSDSGIGDWYEYFFEPVIRLTSLLIVDLPPHASPLLELTLTATGETVACGEMVAGLARDIGGTQWGGQVGIRDYSTKETDAWGVTSVVERAFAKRASFGVVVASARVDAVQALLADYRATPIVLVGDPGYAASAVLGFIRDWSVEISGPDVSLLSIEFEGLA